MNILHGKITKAGWLLLLCMTHTAAGSIIGWGRGCADDAMSLFPAQWYSLHQPSKDDRLSQPHLVLIQWPIGAKDLNPATRTTKPTAGLQGCIDVCTLTCELSCRGLHLSQAINCDPGTSQAGQFINVCVIPRKDVQLCLPSAEISWTLNIQGRLSRRVY